MAYSVNSRVYTDNPLLDGIVHNIKIMVNGIVLKDEDEANNLETPESLDAGQTYCAISKGEYSFEMFTYSRDLLERCGFIPKHKIWLYERDNSLIPDEYRDRLAELGRQEFLDNYIETNNYYRTLAGLPNYGDEELYLDMNLVPPKFRKFFDYELPLSEFTDYKIGLLERYGILQKIQDLHPDKEYLKHLGKHRIDIFTARNADKFELLYLPEAEKIVSERFKEILEKNRLIYLKRYYSLAYKFNGKYYDKFMIVMIICQSMVDMVAETPEWYIRRDVFDLRTVEFVLTANGVKFFSRIPLKYQLSLVRILNKVVKYKSCNKNIFDLASIFDFDNINVFKYYLFKKRKIDDKGNYVTVKKEIHPDIDDPEYTELVDDMTQMYSLFFIKTPTTDTYDNYINDNINLTDYDYIVMDDPYWNSIYKHEDVKDQILEKDFTVQATKYLSFDAEFDISEYEFQIKYFLNLIMNVNSDISKLTLVVPAINDTARFEIRDLIILLYAISFNYYETSTPGIIENTNRFLPEKVIEQSPWIGWDGGRAYHHYPNFENANGSNSDFLEDHPDDSEDILTGEEDLEFDGGISYEMKDVVYQDCDGYNFGLNYMELVGHINGGKAINSYINQKTGTDYFDDASWYFTDNGCESRVPYIDMSNRLFGFNIHADLDYLANVIGFNHRRFGFKRGYTLKDLGVEDFRVPKDLQYVDAYDIMEIYNTNKAIYDKFIDDMIHVDSYDDFEVYQFVYDYLFTVEMDQSYFKLENDFVPKTYTEYILNRDPLLEEFYTVIMSETDLEIRQYQLSEYVDCIIEAMQDYLNNPSMLKHVFYFIPTVNWSTVLQYLGLLIDFFKSYKVQFLEIGATLTYGHKLDNKYIMLDSFRYTDTQYVKADTIIPIDSFTAETEFVRDDYVDITDRAMIYPYYNRVYFDFNGGPSRDRIFYLMVEGNIFISLDGAYSDNNEDDNEYVEFDGGIGRCRLDEIDKSPDTGNSDTSRYESFIDADGGSKTNICPIDNSYPITEDWNGGTSEFNYSVIVIDGGPGKEQNFYADYTEYDFIKDIIGVEPQPAQYDPHEDGLTCDGLTARATDRVYGLYSESGGARTVKDKTIDIDGSYSYDRYNYTTETKSIITHREFYKHYYMDLKVNGSKLNDIQVIEGAIYVDESDYIPATTLLAFKDEFEVTIADMNTKVRELSGRVSTLEDYDFDASINAFVEAEHIKESLEAIDKRIDTIDTSVIVKEAKKYTESENTWTTF